MNSMVRSVVETCNSLNGNNKPYSKPNHNPTEDLPLKDMYDLIDQHKLHLKFLQDNDVCDDTEKVVIIQSIKDVFEMIRVCTATKTNNNDSVSN